MPVDDNETALTNSNQNNFPPLFSTASFKSLRTSDMIFDSRNLRTLTTVYGSYFGLAYNIIHGIIMRTRHFILKLVSDQKLIIFFSDI